MTLQSETNVLDQMSPELQYPVNILGLKQKEIIMGCDLGRQFPLNQYWLDLYFKVADICNFDKHNFNELMADNFINSDDLIGPHTSTRR